MAKSQNPLASKKCRRCGSKKFNYYPSCCSDCWRNPELTDNYTSKSKSKYRYHYLLKKEREHTLSEDYEEVELGSYCPSKYNPRKKICQQCSVNDDNDDEAMCKNKDK